MHDPSPHITIGQLYTNNYTTMMDYKIATHNITQCLQPAIFSCRVAGMLALQQLQKLHCVIKINIQEATATNRKYTTIHTKQLVMNTSSSYQQFMLTVTQNSYSQRTCKATDRKLSLQAQQPQQQLHTENHTEQYNDEIGNKVSTRETI